MALIPISETQLVFGYLHSFINVYRPRRFLLPSLRQEGGVIPFPFPGADVVIGNNHLIQFKRPFYFTTNGIKEFWNFSQPNDIWPPYFRFYIKNEDPTNQFDNLIAATLNGLTAEYVSPMFTDDAEFFRLLRNDVSHLNSYAHIDIAQFNGMQSAIGHNNDHTVIYTEDSVQKGFCYCFSDPKRITAAKQPNHIGDSSDQQYRNASDIIEILYRIFFKEEEHPFERSNLLRACRYLQYRLFMERDIIWTFYFRRTS